MQESTEVDILSDLDELDKAIIRLKIEGRKDSEIAKNLEKHRGTIENRLKKHKVQIAIKELQKKAIDILIDTQSKAARLYRTVIEDETATYVERMIAAKEVLKGVLSEKTTLIADINVIYADDQDKKL